MKERYIIQRYLSPYKTNINDYSNNKINEKVPYPKLKKINPQKKIDLLDKLIYFNNLEEKIIAGISGTFNKQ